MTESQILEQKQQQNKSSKKLHASPSPDITGTKYVILKIFGLNDCNFLTGYCWLHFMDKFC